MRDDTPDATGAVLVQVVPFEVSTLPAVLGATATAATPATVSVPPTATLPLASLTMLLTVAEGWTTVITFAVLMAASYSYKMLIEPASKVSVPSVVKRTCVRAEARDLDPAV